MSTSIWLPSSKNIKGFSGFHRWTTDGSVQHLRPTNQISLLHVLYSEKTQVKYCTQPKSHFTLLTQWAQGHLSLLYLPPSEQSRRSTSPIIWYDGTLRYVFFIIAFTSSKEEITSYGVVMFLSISTSFHYHSGGRVSGIWQYQNHDGRIRWGLAIPIKQTCWRSTGAACYCFMHRRLLTDSLEEEWNCTQVTCALTKTFESLQRKENSPHV